MDPTEADLVIAGGDIVTMNPDREVLVGGSLAVGGDRIVDIGPGADLRERWPDAEVLDARGCVVVPGSINAHQHLANTLRRSRIPDALDAGRAIFDWSMPLHEATTADDEELGATVASVDCLRNGVTTLMEAGTAAHPHRLADAMERVGIRGTVGRWGWDIEQGPHTGSVADTLEAQRALLDAFPRGRITAWLSLVGHSLVSDDLMAGAADLARDRGVRMTMHMSPTESDPEAFLARTGRRPLIHLEELGVLGEHLVVAHAVWIDDTEIEAVLRTDTAVVYTPWAYLRLGQGVGRHGRHAQMHQRGIRVALGGDDGNAGDTVDLLRSAALAAGIAKDSTIDPSWFGAAEAFEMATIGGARAVGMDADIGSLEVGKQADVVVHDATRPEWTPRGDITLQLVWGADGRSVRDVLVGGEIVVRDGSCTLIDEAELHREASHAADALFERAGIDVPHHWPQVDSR